MKRQGGNPGGARNNAGRTKRPAAKKARISITSALHNRNGDTDISHGVMPIRTVGDIWHAFEWNRGTRKSLLSEETRRTNTTLRGEGVGLDHYDVKYGECCSTTFRNYIRGV